MVRVTALRPVFFSGGRSPGAEDGDFFGTAFAHARAPAVKPLWLYGHLSSPSSTRSLERHGARAGDDAVDADAAILASGFSGSAMWCGRTLSEQLAQRASDAS
jgi:hypothetical protein